MPSESELPGFPWAQEGPFCLDCHVKVPTGATVTDTSEYTESEYRTWLSGIPACGASPDASFPDPRELVVPHTTECYYRELPPVVLWKEDPELAEQALERIRRARRPCT